MGWMQLIIFYTDHPFADWYKQRNAGRRTFLAFFKKDRFLDLMIINFENTASHKYVVQKSRVYEWLDNERLGIDFLFLFKNDINFVFKIPLANFVVFILGMAGVWPPEISIVYGLWIQLLLIKVQSASETVFYKLKAFVTLKLLSVLSKQLA